MKSASEFTLVEMKRIRRDRIKPGMQLVSTSSTTNELIDLGVYERKVQATPRIAGGVQIKTSNGVHRLTADMRLWCPMVMPTVCLRCGYEWYRRTPKLPKGLSESKVQEPLLEQATADAEAGGEVA